jgi:hypothetical protein
MKKQDVFTKVLAIAGTVLLWFPILAPILLSIVFGFQGGGFHLDYLMPAELFPVVVIGGGLLVWAALRARSHRGLIAWSLGAALLMLVGGQGLAVVTGLASGETGREGWQFAVVIGAIAAYTAAVISGGVGGILILRDLFKPRQSPA